MSFIVAGGVQFHCQTLGHATQLSVGTGEGGRASSTTVMLHGLLSGSVASWYFTCAPALARERQVVLFDQRGHGRSERTPSGYSSSEQAADLAALTESLPPFILVGHSFGALIAARFALAHPTRLAGLALIEPPLPRQEPIAAQARSWAGPPLDRDNIDDENRRLTTAGIDPAATPPRLLTQMRALLRDTTLIEDLRHEAPVTDADLAALPAPLLFVFGRQSAFARSVPRIRGVQPGATVTILDAGHAIHVDATDALSDCLASFMRSCDASPFHSTRSIAYG